MLVPQGLSPTGWLKGGDSCTHSGTCVRKCKYLTVGNSMAALCSGERYYFQGCKQTSLLLWRETQCLSLEDVHYTNILENLVQKKSSQWGRGISSYWKSCLRTSYSDICLIKPDTEVQGRLYTVISISFWVTSFLNTCILSVSLVKREIQIKMTKTISHPQEWLRRMRVLVEDVGQLDSYIIGGIVKYYSHFGRLFGSFL